MRVPRKEKKKFKKDVNESVNFYLNHISSLLGRDDCHKSNVRFGIAHCLDSINKLKR